jgi:hypothetical protein
MHAHHSDHSAAAAVFANGTYFMDMPLSKITAFEIPEGKSKYCLNFYTNLHETLYVYHATGAHLSSIIYKSLPYQR